MIAFLGGIIIVMFLLGAVMLKLCFALFLMIIEGVVLILGAVFSSIVSAFQKPIEYHPAPVVIETKQKKNEKDEDLAGLTQLDSWKNQLAAEHHYLMELQKQLKKENQTSEVFINGILTKVYPDKLKMAKLEKQISASESKSAGIEMKIRKTCNKYGFEAEDYLVY